MAEFSAPAATDSGSSGRDRNCLPDLGGRHYTGVLAHFHKILRPKTYLEIGVNRGKTLKLAACATIGVDTEFRIDQNVMEAKPFCGLYQMPSDDFFAKHNPEAIFGGKIDMAFLDGLHLCEFLLRDFANTERHCRRNSVVILHDCVPVETAIALRNPGATEPIVAHRRLWWAGDVWRTLLALKRFRPDLDITVLDAPPTGLVCITNLDPQNRTLFEQYGEIVRAMMAYSFDDMSIEDFCAHVGVESTSAIESREQLSARFWL